MSCLKLIYNYKNVHFYAVLKLSMPRLNDTKWPYLGNLVIENVYRQVL